MLELTVTQGGAPTSIVNVTAPFDVSVTLRAFGLAVALGASVPWTITYFFESFGGGAEGTLGNAAGNLNAGSVSAGAACQDPVTLESAIEFNGTTSTTKTTYTVVPPQLAAGETIKITAIASLSGGFFGTGSAFVEGPVIQTR
ncbi:MAG TPA: hypothetical protein VK897_14665 [Anaerolineales bacterium]|nr:hypothetical protein [Anaerolineales bacterium]